MNTTEQIHLLTGQVERLRLYCIALFMALVVLVLCAAAKINRFDELTVERLNVVDATGQPRLVIANAARFPKPVIKGKTYPRAVNPAGLVFFNARGDEVGGIALTDVEAGRGAQRTASHRAPEPERDRRARTLGFERASQAPPGSRQGRSSDTRDAR